MPQDSCEVPASYRPLATLLTNSNQSSLLYGTEIKIFTNGADKFKALMEALRQAQHHIHLRVAHELLKYASHHGVYFLLGIDTGKPVAYFCYVVFHCGKINEKNNPF